MGFVKQLNIYNMGFFSEQAIAEASKQLREQEKSRELILIPKGANSMVVKSVSFKVTEKNNIPMFTIVCAKVLESEKYKTISTNYLMRTTKEGKNIDAQRLMTFVEASFGVKLKPATNPNDEYPDILIQLKAFENKQFRAVVRWEKKLTQRLTEYDSPEIWYTCPIDSNKITQENCPSADKLVLPLSDYDRMRQRGEVPAKNNGSAPNTPNGTTAHNPTDTGDAPPVNEETEDLPF